MRRAVHHDVLQAKNRYIVDRAHHGIISILQEFGKLPTAIASPTDKQVDEDAEAGPFGCLSCEFPCRTRAGEAVHMQRKHGHNSKLRYLYDSTHCPACLREYHMPERVHEHKAIEEKHNRLAPYLVGHGPQPMQPSGEQLDPEDELPAYFDASLLADIDGCIGKCGIGGRLSFGGAQGYNSGQTQVLDYPEHHCRLCFEGTTCSPSTS